jgi:hygromycin-B 7''-O-kinase
MPEQILFPLADTVERYLAIRGDEARLRPAVTALCDRLGLRAVDIVRFGDCSLPVYVVDARVLKLYPEAFQHSYQVERRVLQAIHGRLSIPTPGLEHAGEFEGWSYLVMERLHGQPLTAAWEHLPAAQLHQLATQLGEALAALHATIPPELDTLEPADWELFLAEQRAGCVDRQRAAGLDSAWLAQIPAFLDAVALDASQASPRPVLLHTEVMREHLLVTPHTDGWSLSGLVDFESAMRGAREYEFADLRWWLEQLPPPPVPTLDALAAQWWRLS